jgi:hypothetical protein
MSGWIKIHRSIKKHWLYTEKRKFSKFEAWNDILLSVNYAPSKSVIKGKIIEVKRGESIMSLDTWASRWNWDKSAVRRFFNMLKNDNMIEYVNETVTTRLIVCKYDDYQQEENANETQTKRKRNANKTHTTPIKEEEEEQEEEQSIKADSDNELISKFTNWFNKMYLDVKGKETKYKTMTPTDLNNYKKLKAVYEREDFVKVFKCMLQNPWVKEHNKGTIDHFLRNDNFVKYLNTELEESVKPKFKAPWQQ